MNKYNLTKFYRSNIIGAFLFIILLSFSFVFNYVNSYEKSEIIQNKKFYVEKIINRDRTLIIVDENNNRYNAYFGAYLLGGISVRGPGLITNDNLDKVLYKYIWIDYSYLKLTPYEYINVWKLKSNHIQILESLILYRYKNSLYIANSLNSFGIVLLMMLIAMLFYFKYYYKKN